MIVNRVIEQSILIILKIYILISYTKYNVVVSNARGGAKEQKNRR